jgi:hypothetical protein
MRILCLILALFAASCAQQPIVFTHHPDETGMEPTVATHQPAVVAKKPAVATPDPVVAAKKPTEETRQRPGPPPSVCDTLIGAINRGDWTALQEWAKPGTTADESLKTWQKAADSGHPVQVGKFLNAQIVGGTSKKPYKLYSFSLENKDGTVNPHWLQIKVREEDGKAEIVDFWNFGG